MRVKKVGSERLPYKQRVGGSTPSAPTTRKGKSKQNPEVCRLRDFLFMARTQNFRFEKNHNGNVQDSRVSRLIYLKAFNTMLHF